MRCSIHVCTLTGGCIFTYFYNIAIPFMTTLPRFSVITCKTPSNKNFGLHALQIYVEIMAFKAPCVCKLFSSDMT